jgi:hypothetical protein
MKAMPTSSPPTLYDLEQFVFEIFINFKNNVINGKLTKVVGIKLKPDSYILVNPQFRTLYFLFFCFVQKFGSNSSSNSSQKWE